MDFEWTSMVTEGNISSVMEAIIHTVVSFRREVVENLKLAPEQHTDQWEKMILFIEDTTEEHEKEMSDKMQSQVKQLNDRMEMIKYERKRHSWHAEDLKPVRSSDRLKRYKRRSCFVSTITNDTFCIDACGNVRHPFLVHCEVRYTIGEGWVVLRGKFDEPDKLYQDWTPMDNESGADEEETCEVASRSGQHELLVQFILKIERESENYHISVGKHSEISATPVGEAKPAKLEESTESPFDCTRVQRKVWWYNDCQIQ
ncbi:AGAP012916-PA-like protein [Anopheles sinensis]|uniref:AGAP012916-PA-like protein n=1 Tax=Anopheles sinensis TaxID=74873 RepID=A0A084WEV8_ANOSI|nr:AGAP012916-PA-like protein [Anopheles sinensis]